MNIGYLLKGIVYAFREDSVREDGIARPRTAAWTSCDTVTELTTGTDCIMKFNTSPPQDPPLNPDTNISPKPVDFYPDPDRRPNGFRLRNGVDLSRSDTTFGLSFISDQPTYILGDFNLHSTDGTNTEANRLEEFTDKLNTGNFSNFYTRSTLDPNFARSTDHDGDGSFDHWRPTEVLADAAMPISGDFCDGYIANGFPKNNDNDDCSGGGISAYRNSTLVQDGGTKSWLRIDNTDNSNNNYKYPIRIDRNANVQYDHDNDNDPNDLVTITSEYRTLDEGFDRPNNQGNATATRMNTILVGGIVPSRINQAYGGFHNYPRFLENWMGNIPLYISGSFVQLNFSVYATAPFEIEAWEPGSAVESGQNLDYYGAPARRWGYDVALQYNPPGPVAERFISVGSPRNEFFQEVDADDPYINNLFCAQKDDGSGGIEANVLDNEMCNP